MTSWGYTLSSEEHPPADLVRQAQRAEAAGFDFLTISDHFHPWIDEQGHSPFVWTVLGGVAQATTAVQVGTGVTCPILRIHPAIVAHAAATTAVLFEGRFFLGLGTGEALNEHILGQRWPAVETRLEMLDEAIEVMRELWTGEVVDHHGTHYKVENARLYDVPDDPIPVVVSAFGTKAAELAARDGDGIWMTSPRDDVLRPSGTPAAPVRGSVSTPSAGRRPRPRASPPPTACGRTRASRPALPGPADADPLRAGDDPGQRAAHRRADGLRPRPRSGPGRSAHLRGQGPRPHPPPPDRPGPGRLPPLLGAGAADPSSERTRTRRGGCRTSRPAPAHFVCSSALATPRSAGPASGPRGLIDRGAGPEQRIGADRGHGQVSGHDSSLGRPVVRRPGRRWAMVRSRAALSLSMSLRPVPDQIR